MSKQQENIQVAHAFFEAWNAGDLSKMDPVEADDLQAEAPGGPGPMNKTQNRMYSQGFLDAFPGSRFEVIRTIGQGDYVVTQWEATGTHSGPLGTPSGGTIPPTGKGVSVSGSTVSEVKNGKIKRSWTYWDMSGLLIQLGLMPAM